MAADSDAAPHVSNHKCSLFTGLDHCTLIYVINAFIFSKLFYCSMAWSSMSKTNVRKLQLVQNYPCRIVAGLRKFDHISEALKSLKWLKNMKDRLLFNNFVMVYKCMNNLTPEHRSKIRQRNTRQNMTSRCPNVGLRLAKGLLPSMEQTFTIIHQSISETRKVLLIHRFCIIIM